MTQLIMITASLFIHAESYYKKTRALLALVYAVMYLITDLEDVTFVVKAYVSDVHILKAV